VARILRGEIYWADLDPVRGREQAGLRPVLILSNDLFNRRSGTGAGEIDPGDLAQIVGGLLELIS